MFYIFKAGSHCSTDVVISMRVGKSFQKIATKRLISIDKQWIENVFTKTDELRLMKRPLKENVVNYFKENDVYTKRGLCKCRSILHGLAIVEKEEELMGNRKKRDKVLNNKLSNFQRVDRSAGSHLIKGFLSKYDISVVSEAEKVAQLSGFSFDIFNKEGYLELSTESIKYKNVVFYNCGTQLYLVKNKYINAFGNMYRSKRQKEFSSCKLSKRIKVE